MSDELKRGLEGVPVAESTLSNIDGDAGRLVYRGYAIEDLARDASYEEVCYLLWHGHLPDREELSSFKDAMARERSVAEPRGCRNGDGRLDGRRSELRRRWGRSERRGRWLQRHRCLPQ